MTVTNDSVHDLFQSITFICRHFRPYKIQVEPVFEQGRAVANDFSIKNPDIFIQQFMKAYSVAKEHGILLFYSGARPDVIGLRFCLAACRALVVTTDGDITTCFESYGREHPLSSHFIIGEYTGNGNFELDYDKLQRCFAHTVLDNPHCKGCFCKWHCAGDCTIKTLCEEKGCGFKTTERCIINQELSKFLLLQMIRKSKKPVWVGNR